MRQSGGAGKGKDRRPAQLPQVTLEIRTGCQSRYAEVASSPYLLGAADDCDLVLRDPLIPSAHSYILVAPRRVTICQLGFAPDLHVNGVRLSRAALKNGDLVSFGLVELKVHIEWPRVVSYARGARRAMIGATCRSTVGTIALQPAAEGQRRWTPRLPADDSTLAGALARLGSPRQDDQPSVARETSSEVPRLKQQLDWVLADLRRRMKAC